MWHPAAHVVRKSDNLVWYVSRCLDARDAARLAIAARADEHHALILAGDDRGIYGEYTPKQID